MATIDGVDDLRIGAIVRAVRHKQRLRQSDLAALAGVSQETVSLIELGRLELLTLRTLRRVAGAAGVRLPLEARWRGGEADQLLDRAHAELSARCASVLSRYGWVMVPEMTFSRYGERGSIDILGWHPIHRALLVIEGKTRILDVQATLAGVDRKARLAPSLVKERGWHPRSAGRILVAADLKANRGVSRQHDILFRSALPGTSWEARAWVRRPSGSFRGVWFLALTTRDGRNRNSVTPRRVRL